MTQEILNRNNISALHQAYKQQSQRVTSLEEEMIHLRKQMTQLMLEVQKFKSQMDIKRVVGPTG